MKPSELTFIIRHHLSEHWGSLDDKDGDVPTLIIDKLLGLRETLIKLLPESRSDHGYLTGEGFDQRTPNMTVQ